MANCIVCLSHFCEAHGPSSIICTQEAQDPEPLILKSSSKLQSCSSCKLMLPKEAMNLVTTAQSHPLVSAERVSYVSNQYPSIRERYTVMTKLVMKALSVETTSDISKPLFLGDTNNGFCIYKNFKVSDQSARGGERKYCLMVLSDVELVLLRNWDIVNDYLTDMIDRIQARVQEYRNLQLQTSTTLDNEKYLRRSVIKPKSLIELTNDTALFVKLHLWAIALIKDLNQCV